MLRGAQNGYGKPVVLVVDQDGSGKPLIQEDFFMPFNHAVVWLDHQQAHVIHFNPTASEADVIKTRSSHTHLHHKAGSAGGARSVASPAYLHEVLQAVADAKEILIVGPGSAKLELAKHAGKHDPAISDKIVGVETVDHLSDGQVLAYARKYFVRVDNLKGDSVF
jgi:hypothetical protein